MNEHEPLWKNNQDLKQQLSVIKALLAKLNKVNEALQAENAELRSLLGELVEVGTESDFSTQFAYWDDGFNRYQCRGCDSEMIYDSEIWKCTNPTCPAVRARAYTEATDDRPDET